MSLDACRRRPAKVALLAMLMSAGCGGGAGEPVFSVGVVAPFTGQEGAPVYGHNIRNAVQMAADELNAQGGIGGRQIELHFEDSQLLSAVAVAAVQKLISFHDVSVIIGPVASSSTMAVSRLVEENRVVLVSPASTSHQISGLSPFVFRTIAPDNYEAEAMLEYLWDRGHRRFALAFVDNAGTRGPAEVFKRLAEPRGGEITAFEVIPQGGTDVRQQMTKLAASKADAVYLMGYAMELGSMIKQYREQDRETPVFSYQVMEEPKVREIAGPAAEGIVFTTPTIFGSRSSGQPREFIERYREAYGEEPGIFSANAYDALMVVAAAVESHGFAPEEIRQGLLAIRGFDGASGRFDIDSMGDSNQMPHFLVVKGGRLVPVAETQGEP